MTAFLPEEYLRDDRGRIRPSSLLILLLVIGMAASHAVQVWTLFIPSSLFKTFHLCMAIVTLFVIAAQKREAPLNKFLRYAMAVAAFGCLVYIFVSFDALIHDRLFGPSQIDVVVGVTLLFVAVSAATGVWGLTIPILAVGALLYGYFGASFSGDLFYHSGIKFERLISYTSIPFFEGLLGSMTGLSGSLIFVFMLFAGLLKSTGGIDFIITLATRLGGRSRGGPAQVAVIGSGIMGMISGSTVANVASTGSITIPLMKRHGLRPAYAGAVEAVASTGGQFMPPVMGLTAFLIVGITGVPYGTVMLAALMPALIYYTNLIIAVHLYAVSTELALAPKDTGNDRQTSLRDEIAQYGHLLLAIGLLVYLLIGRMPPGHAAVVATIFIAVAEVAKQLLIHRRNLIEGVKQSISRILSGLHDGVSNGVQLAVVIAVIGVLVDMMTTTGFAQKLSNLMLGVADENLLILLALAALSCLIFGLGMPTPAAYSLVAVVGAPALVDFGIDVLAAHMFVFFFANMSAITPPVALAALVGAKLANASYPKTALIASRLGLPGFILPFLFVLYPELLMLEGNLLTRITTFALTLLSFVALNIALSGTLLRPRIEWWMRVLTFVSTACLIYPSLYLKLAGLACFGIAIALELSRSSPIPKQNPLEQETTQ